MANITGARICDMIKQADLSACECNEIVDCLKKEMSSEVIGGVIYTTEDVRKAFKTQGIQNASEELIDAVAMKLADEDSFNKFAELGYNLIETTIEEFPAVTHITDIVWDVDDASELKDLPTSVDIKGVLSTEYISDYLSDEYDYCVKSYSVEVEEA